MDFSLGVIGAGNMGMAIINGALRAGILRPEQICLSDPQPAKTRPLEELGGHRAADNRQAAERADLVLLAVKPQVVDAVLEEISPLVSGKCVISIVAGVSRAYLCGRLPGAHVVCVMPNTPLLLGVGACAITPQEDVPEDLYQAARAVFAAAGKVAEVPAEKMNEIIPVNGSSPAFFFRMAEVMVNCARERGIDGDTAAVLAAQTMAGAAQMLLNSGKTPEELTRQVCSPGGTTLAALTAFDDLDFRGVIAEAFDRCIRRAYELGR